MTSGEDIFWKEGRVCETGPWHGSMLGKFEEGKEVSMAKV